MIDVSGIPNEPGVYALFDKDGIVVYIGTSGKLKQRVHDQKRWFGSRFDAAAFLICHDKRQRLTMEKWFISKHKPKLNHPTTYGSKVKLKFRKAAGK